MRSQQEIVDRIVRFIEERSDPLNFRLEVLYMALTSESAETLFGSAFKDDADLSWDKPVYDSDETTRRAAIEYLAFAFGKALDHRGISVGLSVAKMREFLWLLGIEDQVADWETYANYGCPVLRQVAKVLDVKEPDDERFDRMARGLICEESGCPEMGCGR